tara:strand:- start:45 stop:635 length:591 start_codon:yes stop_codon:yes gene_type:complete
MIVVAKYKEDIEWLKGHDCTIIDKSLEHNNVGREASSYLSFIIDNYGDLPETCVFTQANIADHCGSNDINILLNLEAQAREYGLSKPTYSTDWVWGPDFNLHPDYDGMLKNPDMYQDGKVITFYEFFKKLFPTHLFPYPMPVYPHAIFAVRRDIILKYPLQFYERLIKITNHHKCPAEAYFMERLWAYMFYYQKHL